MLLYSINYILQIYEDKRITLKLNFTLFALSKKNEQNHYFFHTVLRLNQILYIYHNVVLR